MYLHWVLNVHILYGSPMCCSGHEQLGIWLTTLHSAFIPQVPGHGSWHLFWRQARFEGQSEFNKHSGLQSSYGFPKYPGKHVHDPALFLSLHSALAPQGDGMQGVGLSCTEFSICMMLQPRNGSPEKPFWHKHIGVWLTTLHSAFVPQDPGQGSLHFLLIQAILVAHSVLLVHSGRQLGGDPIYSFMQLHWALSPFSMHSELGPHGEGRQGFTFTGGVAARKTTIKI